MHTLELALSCLDYKPYLDPSHPDFDEEEYKFLEMAAKARKEKWMQENGTRNGNRWTIGAIKPELDKASPDFDPVKYAADQLICKDMNDYDMAQATLPDRRAAYKALKALIAAKL